MATPTDQELLDAVLAALGGTLDRNAQELRIGGRLVSSLPIPDLMALRGDLEFRIARKAKKGPLLVRFGVPD